MHTVIKSGYVKARKNYYSDASTNFDFASHVEGYRISEFEDLGMTDEEIKSIIDSAERNWRIEVGEVHYYQVGVYDGEMYTYRSSKEIHEICMKYDLYSED